MKLEDHLRNIRESIDVINESIQKGIEERQRSIGFHASVAGAEMLEVYLHENNLINPGSTIKHELFNSIKKAEEKFNFDFERKKEIMQILCNIESKRNLLCYGKPRPKEEIISVIDLFNKLKRIFEELGLKWS